MKEGTIYQIFHFPTLGVRTGKPWGEWWTLARYDGVVGKDKKKGAKRFVMMASNIPKMVSVPIEELNDLMVVKDIRKYHMKKIPMEDLPLFVNSAHMYPEFDRVLKEQIC